MADTAVSQPLRTIEAHLPATLLIVQLRASHAELLALPVPHRLAEILQRPPQASPHLHERSLTASAEDRVWS
jgi:hypothetical protein